MKYETKIKDVAVKNNYPIDVEQVKKLMNGGMPSWTKQIIIEGPLVDDNWKSGNTVGELINELKKLPKDMPVEYNDAGISVETRHNLEFDGETFYVHSSLAVSEKLDENR